jgi:TPP-dependent pyruvate/acetoin dehydrogenase alpha subunit
MLDDTRLVHLYRQMVLIRRFDELALEHRLAGRVYGVVHPYIGEEAVAVGVCAVLRPDDRIVSTHRGHGHCIAKGADIKRMMAELYGRRDGYCRGKGGSMHIADFSIGMLGSNGIVGAGIPIAAGAALAAAMDGKGGVAVSFLGDGATGQGVFHEVLNLAATWRLPLVCVCENNLYASDAAASEIHAVQDMVDRATGYGIPGVAVDGNDVLAVYDAAEFAVARARAGQGPTLVECKTYRWGVHSQRAAPVPERRPPDEIARWRERDPVALFERRLVQLGAMRPGGAERIAQEVQDQLAEAVRFAEDSPFPEPADALADVFADPT